jgi:hypothetical protein
MPSGCRVRRAAPKTTEFVEPASTVKSGAYLSGLGCPRRTALNVGQIE